MASMRISRARGRGWWRGCWGEGEYRCVVGEVPRLGMKDGFGEAMCEQCRTKPEAVMGTIAEGWGEKYVEGFEVVKTIDRLEASLARL